MAKKPHTWQISFTNKAWQVEIKKSKTKLNINSAVYKNVMETKAQWACWSKWISKMPFKTDCFWIKTSTCESWWHVKWVIIINLIFMLLMIKRVIVWLILIGWAWIPREGIIDLTKHWIILDQITLFQMKFCMKILRHRRLFTTNSRTQTHTEIQSNGSKQWIASNTVPKNHLKINYRP